MDCTAEHSPPLFVGDPASFLAGIADEHQRAKAAEQLRNKVKKCPVCQKPNAFTLPTCNGCSNDLSKVVIVFLCVCVIIL